MCGIPRYRAGKPLLTLILRVPGASRVNQGESESKAGAPEVRMEMFR